MADTFVSTLSQQVSERLKAVYPVQLLNVSQLELQTYFEETLVEALPGQIDLSTSRPDYEAILARFMYDLDRDGAWNDNSLAATGKMFLRAVASDASFSQFSIMRSVQEMHPHTAINDSSIYAHARGRGVRLTRKKPQRVSVNLTRQDFTGNVIIPKWSTWTIGDTAYFNPDTITFLNGQLTAQTVLSQGAVTSETIVSNGSSYQVLEVGNENWQIADQEVRVTINTVEWTRTEEPLFLFDRNDRIFYDNTLPNGDAELKFGNGIYGAKPANGSNIVVQWVETLGANAPTVLPEQLVRFTSNTPVVFIEGEVVTTITSGLDEPPVSYYRQFAGDLSTMVVNKAAHRRADHRAKALAFPGVYDVRFKGQAETQPDRPSYAMVAEVVLLTDPLFTPAQWEAFAAYFESGVAFKPKLLRVDAVSVPINIAAEVYCNPNANLEEIRKQLTAQIREEFAPKPGSLNYNIYLNDIASILEGQGSLRRQISHSIITSPAQNVILPDPDSWVKIVNINLTMKYSVREYNGRVS